MIFHISIPSREPERVARVIAEIWAGQAFPFPPLMKMGSWAAISGENLGTGIECYPFGGRIFPSEEEYPTGFTVKVDAPATDTDDAAVGRIATHAAISTSLSQDEIFAIAAREGWLSRFAQRGRFHVVELWLENMVMLEVLTEPLQQEYLATQSIEAWRGGSAAMTRNQPPPEAG